MKRGLVATLSALAVALLVVSLIAAQSTQPIADTFDADASGWTPTLHRYSDGNYYAYADTTWAASMTFTSGLFWWQTTSSATGVIQVTWRDAQYRPDIQRSVYLQPGAYKVALRAGADQDDRLSLLVSGNGVAEPGEYLKNNNGQLSPQWYTYYTDVFVVNQPGLVVFTLSAGAGFWLDSFTLDIYASGNTPTPAATLAYTPVPPAYQATPMPVPTQFCQEATAAHSVPAEFGATPTPTPNASNASYTDAFNYSALADFWETSGSGIAVDAAMSGPDNAAGVLAMPYSSGTGVALVLVAPITPTYYVDGWAMASALAIGETAAVQVYLYNGAWQAAGSSGFGAGAWYPFHIAVTDPGGGPFSALAISVAGPSGASAYLDNLTIYNSLSLAPVCGFSVSSPDGLMDNYVTYPADKPCPPTNSGIGNVPNNFWGPLFQWMSLQFLTITAMWPIHIDKGYAAAIRQLVDAPFWRYVSVVTRMFDLRPILALAAVLIALEIVRLLYSLWRLILKIIPMMG